MAGNFPRGAEIDAPGHNSTYYDSATGRYFIIFHTRFPGQGEFHQIRVHEMFDERRWLAGGGASALRTADQ